MFATSVSNSEDRLPGGSHGAPDHQHCWQQWLVPAWGHTLRHSFPLQATTAGVIALPNALMVADIG